jgi:hypothetical protein
LVLCAGALFRLVDLVLEHMVKSLSVSCKKVSSVSVWLAGWLWNFPPRKDTDVLYWVRQTVQKLTMSTKTGAGSIRFVAPAICFCLALGVG